MIALTDWWTMKSMVLLTCSLLEEVGTQTGISTTRDILTVESRVAAEGISFLTITLPQYDKDFLSSIAEGAIRPYHFAGLARQNGTELPKFMGGFFELLYSPDGTWKDIQGAHHLIRALRQIFLLHSKVELPCSPKRVQKALDAYITTDESIRRITDDYMAEFRRAADLIFCKFFIDVNDDIALGILEPRHSGGALATRETFNSRFSSRIWTDRLQEVFPFWDYLCSSSYELLDEESVSILDRTEETPSKVTTVPKTLKGPRIIAMEPVYNQMVQQGILRLLTSNLRKYPSIWEGCCWEYQDFNRLLSQIGSETGKLATIDLSEASDRVSAQLIFEGLLNPLYLAYFRIAVNASRSERANVDGNVIVLNKFASMGSSLTFPMETFVFYTIVHIAWEWCYGSFPSNPLTPEQGVRVYGDDIIVPVELVPYLLDLLNAFGLKVNPHKSFWEGNFRESCGSDWYKGMPVSPVRLRTPLPEKVSQYAEIVRTIEFANRLYEAGYFDTAALVATHLRGLRYVPFVPYRSTALGLWTHDSDLVKRRFNPTLHRSEVKSLIPRLNKPYDPLDGYGALSKYFMSPYEDRDPKHLYRDGRSQCVGLTTGWSVG